MGAATDISFTLVDFDQVLVAGGKRERFSVLVTIIRQRVGEACDEARGEAWTQKVVEGSSEIE